MNNTITIAIILLTFALLAFSAFYVPARLASWLKCKRKRWIIAVYVVAVIASFLSFALVGELKNLPLLWIAKILILFLGLHMYLFTYLVLAELVRPFAKEKVKTLALGVLGLAGLTVVYGFWNSYQYKVRTVEIAVPGLREEVRILFFISQTFIWGPTVAQGHWTLLFSKSSIPSQIWLS